MFWDNLVQFLFALAASMGIFFFAGLLLFLTTQLAYSPDAQLSIPWQFGMTYGFSLLSMCAVLCWVYGNGAGLYMGIAVGLEFLGIRMYSIERYWPLASYVLLIAFICMLWIQLKREELED
jgi:hypothetical protein